MRGGPAINRNTRVITESDDPALPNDVPILDWLTENASAVRDAIGVSTGGGTLDTFRAVTTFPASVAEDDAVLLIKATGTLPMPSPTAGRKLVIRARGGACTLTISGNHIEDGSANLTNSFVLLDNAGVMFRGDGTNWIQFPG